MKRELEMLKQDAGAVSVECFSNIENTATSAGYAIVATVPAALDWDELREIVDDIFSLDITSAYDCTGQWFSRGLSLVLGSTYESDGGPVREAYITVSYGVDI